MRLFIFSRQYAAWIWASWAIDAFCILVGICIPLAKFANRAELYSIIGAALGSFFAVGGAAVIWRMQNNENARKAADVVASICGDTLRGLGFLSQMPQYTPGHGDATTLLGSTKKAIDGVFFKFTRFAQTLQNLLPGQIENLMAIENILKRTSDQIETADNLPGEENRHDAMFAMRGAMLLSKEGIEKSLGDMRRIL